MIVITNLYLSKLYGALRLLSDLLDKGWKLGSINSLLKRIRKTDSLQQTVQDGYNCLATRQRQTVFYA